MPDVAAAEAPGRVNLIGDHTDYHEGFVLPIVIPQKTGVRLRRRADARVCALTTSMDDSRKEFELGRETLGQGWIDYVQGVTVSLARHGFALSGFDAAIESTVPVGAGLSSSAALAVSLLRGLRALLDIDLDDVRLARLAQEAETAFVGAPVGIMDQLAVSLGCPGEALLIDTRTLAVTRVPVPGSLEVVVIDSGMPHAHAGGKYQTRRRESFRVRQQVQDDLFPHVAVEEHRFVDRVARHVVPDSRLLDG
jgi:galactokinase